MILIITHPFYFKFIEEEDIKILLTIDIRKYIHFNNKKELSIGDVFFDKNNQLFYVFSFIKKSVQFYGITGFGFLEIGPNEKTKSYEEYNYLYFKDIVENERDMIYLGNIYLNKEINLKSILYEKKHYQSFDYKNLIYNFSIFNRYNQIAIKFKNKEIQHLNIYEKESILLLYKKYQNKEPLDFNIELSMYFSDYVNDEFYKKRIKELKGFYNKPIIDILSGSIYHLKENKNSQKKLFLILNIAKGSKSENELKAVNLLYFYLDFDGHVKIKNKNNEIINKLIMNPSSNNFYYHYPYNEDDEIYINYYLYFI